MKYDIIFVSDKKKEHFSLHYKPIYKLNLFIMKTKVTKATIVEIINEYRTISSIKKMQPTIMEKYGIEKKSDFVKLVLRPCKEKIHTAIEANYNGAILNVLDGQKALLDALKRAKKDRRFVKECANLDINLQTTDYIVNRYYPHISQDGQIAHKCYQYMTDDNGDFILDDKGHRIIVNTWYEITDITASNASAIIVRCLRKMKSIAKHEIALTENWNIVKIGK